MDPKDVEIKQTLKRWAARQTPPAEVRPRLLEAARYPRFHSERSPNSQLPDMSQRLFSWALVYSSIGRGVNALQLVS